MNKNNLITALIVGSTTILGGIAIFTAYKLYQLQSGPGNPDSAPQAQVLPSPTPEVTSACQPLTFSIVSEEVSQVAQTSPSPSPTSTPVADSGVGGGELAQASPTATPTIRPTATPTTSPTSTPTSTPTPRPTATPQPSAIAQASPTSTTTAANLPEAGVSFPTYLAIIAALFLIMGAILIAL